MKKTKYLFLAFFAVLFLMTGCSKEEEQPVVEQQNTTLGDDAIARMQNEVYSRQSMKVGDNLFYMIWDFGPNGDIVYFLSKKPICVENQTNQILLGVTYYWDETLPGENKWHLFDHYQYGIKKPCIKAGGEIHSHGTYLWNPGDKESFACAVYQYTPATGAITLLSIEFKIDVTIDDIVW